MRVMQGISTLSFERLDCTSLGVNLLRDEGDVESDNERETEEVCMRLFNPKAVQ